MKLQKVVMLLFFMFFSVLNVQGQVTVSGAVSGNGNYSTLGAAFMAIGTSQTGANIAIAITANTTETAIASLGAGDWASVRITPSGGAWTISGDLPSELIKLDGADNVTIDGVNANGLTISNSSTSSVTGTSTIKFINDATNNTITNCTLLGSATMTVSTEGGVVFFSTGTNGNDGNTISNCNVGPAGSNLPSKLIFSKGTTNSATTCNSGITVTGCNLYDFFAGGGAAAIYALPGNTAWTVTNNKVYQTAPRTFTTSGAFYGIYFNSAAYGDNVQITGNTIGYTNASGSGTLTVTCPTGIFYGVYLNTLPTATSACNVNNNTIANISFTSTSGQFFGVNNAALSGSTNTININGNTLRNISALTTTGDVHGIQGGIAAILNCNNNTIDNLSRNTAGYLYGIKYTSPTDVTVDGNTITNLTCSATTGSAGFYGIACSNNPVTETITNNVLSNFSSASTSNQLNYGMYFAATSGNKTIRNNVLNGFTLSGSTSSVYGIHLYRAGSINEISGNKIYSFSGGAIVYGIFVESGTTNNVFKNKIYGLSTSVSSTAVYGMNFAGGTTQNVYNNIIGNLTAPVADLSSGPNQVIGIKAVALSSMNMNLYNNTVALNATSTGSNFGSSAVYVDDASVLTLRNNILVNNSAANGTGLSVALRKPSLTNYNAASNNNLFYGTAIYTNGTNTDLTLDAFKTRAAGPDLLSVNENPSFASTTGSAVNYLHINPAVPTQIESRGVAIASVIDDFDGDVRNVSTPDIGADEFAGISLSALAINNVGITPTGGGLCTAVSRTVTANITAGTNTINSVLLKYSFNGIVQTPIVMTGGTVAAGTTSTFTGTIPVAVPANANVTWTVAASDASGERTTMGTAYKDQPLFGAKADVTASSTVICSGGGSVLTAAIAPQMTPFSTSFETGLSSFIGDYVSGVPILEQSALYSNGAASMRFYSVSTGADVSASSASNINLSTMPQAYLTFSHIAALNGPSVSSDFGYVQYSTDGGATWTSFPTSSYMGSGTLYNGVVSFSTRSYSSWSSSIIASGSVPTDALWKDETIAIPASALTSQFRIRFRYTTGGSLNYYGWMIDNVKIVSSLPMAPVSYSWSDGSSVVGTGSSLTVSPTSTTTYTATIAYAGCTVSAPVTITVGAAQPTASAQTFCSGATVGNLAATGTGIKWYAGSTGGSVLLSTDALSTGTYYVTQTLQGCESARLAVQVTVNTVGAPAGPSIQAISVGTPSDATIEDLVPSGANILWYPTAADALAGTNAITAGTQLTNGSVYYAMQTVGGCRSTSYLAVTATVTLGAKDFALRYLKLYPNPVSDNLVIENSEMITNVEVFNIAGQKILSKSANSLITTIAMSEFAGGTYFVKVATEDTVKTVKVIKK